MIGISPMRECSSIPRLACSVHVTRWWWPVLSSTPRGVRGTYILFEDNLTVQYSTIYAS